YRVWFCKSRLCPMCNWRRAMKHGIQSQKVVAEVIKQKPTVRWLFLTLTVKNVYDGEELNKSLSDMAQGFRRMMQYKKINKIGRDTSELQSRFDLVCRLLLEKKKHNKHI